jgi:hypothetical protein
MLRALLPWRDFVIDTRWTPDVAIVEIRKRLGRPQLFGWGESAPFVGELNGNAFRFRHEKAPLRKGTGPAVIDAVVEHSHHNGARIRVTMRVNMSSMVSLIIFVGFIAFTVLRAPADAKWAMGAFVSFGLLFFGSVTVIRFASQANKAERFLREIFANAPAFPAPVETGVAYR